MTSPQHGRRRAAPAQDSGAASPASATASAAPVLEVPARTPHRPDVDPIVPEVSEKPAPTHSTKRRSAGRNLPAAIIVGVTLILMVLSAIYLVPAMLTPLVALVVVIGALEVTNALENANLRVPAIPLLVASVGMIVSAAVYGADGLLVSAAVGVLVLIVWRVVEATGLMAVRDTVASIFTLLWVPFLASFAVLLMAQPHGQHKLLFVLAVPIANDVGGYVAGVLLGKHPMAPSISPKKSWEGFAGSLFTGVVIAALIGHFLLPELGAGVAALFGVVMVVVATIGDLCESLLKRDLGIKDMGQLLPGHGGIMDRLDSMLLTAPTLFIMLALWEAFGG